MTAARVKLSHITEQISQSSAGEQYRLLISALKALLERAHSHLADQRAVRAMTELLSRKGNEYMVKLAWLDPFIRLEGLICFREWDKYVPSVNSE